MAAAVDVKWPVLHRKLSGRQGGQVLACQVTF